MSLISLVAEAILGLVLLAFVAFYFYTEHRWAEERRQLINHVLSQSPGEFIALQRASEPRVAKAQRPENVDMKPLGL